MMLAHLKNRFATCKRKALRQPSGQARPIEHARGDLTRVQSINARQIHRVGLLPIAPDIREALDPASRTKIVLSEVLRPV
jgi:hypothetical protein